MIKINDTATMISIARYIDKSIGGAVSSGSCIKYRDKSSEWYSMESSSSPSCAEISGISR